MSSNDENVKKQEEPILYESNYRLASILLAIALLICFFQMPILHRKNLSDGTITCPQAGVDLVSGLASSDSVPTLKILSNSKDIVIPDLTNDLYQLANACFMHMMLLVILNLFVCILAKQAGLVHMILPILALGCIGVFALNTGNTKYAAIIKSQGIVLEYRFVTILIMVLLAVASATVGLLSAMKKNRLPIKKFFREQASLTLVLLGSWAATVIILEADMRQSLLYRSPLPSVIMMLALVISSIVVRGYLKSRSEKFSGQLSSLGITIFLWWVINGFLCVSATLAQYQCHAPLCSP